MRFECFSSRNECDWGEKCAFSMLDLRVQMWLGNCVTCEARCDTHVNSLLMPTMTTHKHSRMSTSHYWRSRNLRQQLLGNYPRLFCTALDNKASMYTANKTNSRINDCTAWKEFLHSKMLQSGDNTGEDDFGHLIMIILVVE